MNGNQDDDVVQKGSEPMRNFSERRVLHFEDIRKRSERIPKRTEIGSQVLINHSEKNNNCKSFVRHIIPNTAEEIRNLSERQQNDSESVRNESEVHTNEHVAPPVFVPNDAESVQTSASEQSRTAPTCAPRHEAFTITVREAARIFDEAGVPRTERAITNWCNRSARGITRLDACFNEEERKYYITPESIERIIKEERKKFQYLDFRSGGSLSPEANDLSEQLRNVRKDDPRAEQDTEESTAKPSGADTEEMRSDRRSRNTDTEQRATPPQEEPTPGDASVLTEDERSRLKELQMENYELRVQLEGQRYLVRQFDSLVDGERERHEREKIALVDRLTDARHKIGSLEEKLLQLEAPKGAIREAEIKPGSAESLMSDSEPTEASW